MRIKKIYVVDGDYFFARTFIQKLNKSGNYDIVHFSNFDEASINMPYDNPQLVLIEHNLKGRTGLDSIPIIRQALPDCEIVMVSDQNDVEVVDTAYKRGVTKYFRKDILLLDHVEGLIKQYEAPFDSNLNQLFG
ncbi:response regulator [Paracrocinitomix mangrovi]|uniref:response regulator n=1 Tax=Paracrocinitomix mangrovi TaxID=2862509 RepID=UPI001C8DA5CE|nr:response regulator [Paracrocinitomix mangrovi]UKN01144.1 response regulator [Paracrocinitomix mangrovi]